MYGPPRLVDAGQTLEGNVSARKVHTNADSVTIKPLYSSAGTTPRGLMEKKSGARGTERSITNSSYGICSSARMMCARYASDHQVSIEMFFYGTLDIVSIF